MAAPGGCATPGKDGSAIITAGTIIDSYYAGSGTSASNTVTLGPKRAGSAAANIAVGDLVLIMQMQDGSASDFGTAAASYGTNTSTAGLYEYATVQSVVGAVITLDTPLTNTYRQNYSNRQIFQVIRVPQYSSVTVSGTISPLPWTIDAAGNGTGGVLAMDVAGALTLNANLNAKGLGFRGAGALNVAINRAGGAFNDQRYPASTDNGASKGEGTAGTPANVFNGTAAYSTYTSNYTNGDNGQGAPGNAGGGGNDGSPTNQSNGYNSGGGGGSNAGAGGVGGLHWNSGNVGLDAGGRGARATTPSATSVFLGGGGGAGSSNNNGNTNAITTYPPNATGGGADGPVSSSGASGGGIILVRSQTLSGAGQIDASGNRAYNVSGGSEAAGAGGAGGSVVLRVASGGGSPAINVSGGGGGDANYYRHGPGGGGGGGFVSTSSNLSPVNNIAGGAQGVDSTTQAPTGYTPTTYGSAAGAGGATVTTAPPTPTACFPVLTVTKATTTANRTQGIDTTATYSIVVTNTGGPADGVSISDALPAPFTYTPAAITPVYAGGASGPASVTGSGANTVIFGTAGGTVANSFSIPFGGSVTLTFNVNLNAAAAGTYQNPATTTFTDPTRTAAQTASPGGTYTNTGAVGGSNYAAGSTPNEDVIIAPRVDLSVTKTVDNATPAVGSSVVFTVTVANAANLSNATGVAVTDLLPSGYTYVSATPSQGTYVAGTGVWTVGAVNSGSSANITITATVLGSGSYVNTAQVTAAGQTDLDSLPNDGAGDDFATLTPSIRPTASDVTFSSLPSSAGPTTISSLAATDPDGTIASYTVSTLPLAAQGVLYLADGVTAVTAAQVLTPAQAAGLRFDPAATFNGNATFTFTATDNTGLVDLTPATYTVVVTNTPPVATDVTNASIPSTAGATAISSLAATDADGTIASYTVSTLPLPAQGTLFLADGVTAVTAGQVLTPAQAAGLRFDPSGTFTGNSTFTFTATDNNGAVDATPATFTIPVGNNPPTAVDTTTAAIPGNAGPTTISSLNAADTDGTIASYTVLTLPPAAQGVLYLTDGVTAATAGQVLTPAQAAGLRFDPSGTFAGNATFTFAATDNLGAVGATPATYTIPVINTPPVATDVTTAAINDNAGPTTISSLAATDVDGTVVSYTVSTLPPVAQGILYFADGVTGVTAGQVLTLAQAAGLRFDPSGTFTGNSSFTFTATDNAGATDATPATFTIPVTSAIDLSLTKTSSPSSPAVGGTVTFTVTVNNAGPSIATGVAVGDQLPAGYAFVSSNPSQGNYDGVSGIWSVGSLNASGTATLTVTATVLASGPYANTAQVTATNETDLDSTPGNNAAAEDDQATDTPVPSPRADLRVNKSVTPSNPAIGANATFVVTVSNNGPSTATGVVLTDQLPSGFTLVSATPAQGAYNAGTGIWTVGSIANAGNTTLTIVATVRSSGSYTNVAEVTASGVIDPTSTPNDGTGDDRDSVGITPAGFSTLSGRVYADVNLTGTDNAEPGIAGVSLTLTGTDISGNPVSVSATTDGTGAFGFAGLPPSDSSGYTIAETQPANYSSGATNNGTPAGTTSVNAISDIVVPANTTGTGYAFGEQRADISVVKTASSTTPAVGGNVTFTVTASNAGPTNASGVVITDALPNGYTYISDSGAGAYVPATGLWTVGNLAASGNATLSITARVAPSGNYANTAQLTGSNQADPDSTPNNNNPAEDDQSISSLTPVATIDLSLTKTSSPTAPSVGSNVTFTVTVANAANLSTATGAQITDLLPSGYSFISATPSSGTYNALTGLWTLGSLNAGSSATLSVVAQVLATGPYANTAQVTAADQPDADSAPNNNAPLEDDQATDTPVPAPRADLSLGKTVSNAAPNIGSNVAFLVTLSNAGPSAATGVIVKDALPSGYSFVSATPSGTTTYLSGTWTVGTVANGASATLTVIATVNPSGNYTNVAEITASNEIDPDSTPNDGAGDDYATKGVTPAGLSSLSGRVYADVNLSGTDNLEPGIAGVTVSLAGTDANGATVNLSTTTDSTGAYTFAGLLPPQTATTYAVTETQPVGYNGAVSNVGTGAGGVSGSNQVTGISFPSGTAATDYSFAEARADISVTKSASTTNPNVGTNVTFTISVSNAGPTNATGIVVADALPTGFTLLGTPTATAGTYSSGTGLWTVGALASGATQTLTISASVNPSGNYTNVAQLTASDQADPNSTPNNNNSSENDQAAAPLTPTPVADIAVSKTGPARVAGGASVTYTVTVVNNGPSSASNVVVTDTLPSALTNVTASSGGVVTSNTVTWTLPTLAIGAPVSFTVTGTAPSTGTLLNLVSASSSTLDTTPNNNDSNPANDPVGSPSSVTTQVVSAPTVTKSFSSNPIASGGTSTLTVTLNNPNTTALTGAGITDPLPAGLTPVAATAATTCAGGTVSQTATTLTLTGGTIPASGSCTLTVQVKPSSSASGKGAQVNTIPAGALTSNESPASPASATATLEIASVGAAKSATSPVNNGDGTYSVTYTITLENLGSVALSNVQALENLSATFPSPATFAIQTAPVAGAGLSINPAFNGSSNTDLLTAAASSLAVSASRTVVFTVRVTPGATPPATTFSNSVTASATGPGPTPVSDLSNAGTDPDPNGNGNPGDPISENASTPVNFSENPAIGVAKEAAAPISNGDGTYTVPFTVVVRNYGDVPLVNIAAIEHLTATFGTTLVSSSVPTLAVGSAGTVTPNPGFTGTGANTNLIAAGSSLAVGESATFDFSVVIRPSATASSFANNVTAQGNSPAGTPVTDDSTNGTDPNPTPGTPPTDDTAITPIVFGVITGRAFTDTNGDGVQQASEPNLTSTPVTITPTGGTPFTVTTDGAGVYSAAVPAGSTSADVTDPAGTILTTANDPQTKLVSAGATTTNTPVGFQATAGLVGRVFNDTNGNGIQDAGEAGIAGLTVTVTPIGGGPPVTATTNSSGDYTVTGLAAGQYSADVTDPTGVVLTTANDPQPVTVAPNGAGSAAPVGFQPTGTVVGRVFRDDNGNGSQASTEVGLAGVQVRVTNGSFTQVVTTDANGDYAIAGVPIGTATVDIVDSTLPVSVTQTAGTDPSAVTALAGTSNNAGADGYRLPAPIATNNTATTPINTPVTFPVTSDDSATSPLTISASSVDLDPSTPSEDKTRTVPEGVYTANPNGTVTFTPNAGVTGSVTPIQYTVKDSSTNVSNAATLAVTIGAATLGDVTGEVFNDLNGNDVNDAGEGLAGVQVTVTSGASTQTVTTNLTGTYTALGLPVGTASVKILTSTLPAGLTQTVGTDPSSVTVVAGTTANAGLDGYRAGPPVAVGDAANAPFNTAVTFPITGNDSASSGSAIDPASVTFPVAGQPSGSSISPDGKTLTTPSGVFTVDSLGNVTFTPTAGFTGVVPSVVYTVKDGSGQLSNTAPISVTVGTATTGVVSGVVYRDDNGDGVQNSSEPGLSGVSVVIAPTSGPSVTAITDVNGNYSAANIPLGNAAVDITDSSLPAGAVATVAGADPTTINVVTGNNDAGIDGYRLAKPVATNDNATTPVGTPVTFSVTGNDTASNPYTIVPSSVDLDPAAPGVQIAINVPEGVYTVNGVGEISFVPSAGFSGNATPIQYTVKDSTGQTSSPATVAVLVTPTVSNDTATTDLNTPVTIPVLSNDLGSLLPASLVFPTTTGQPSGSSVSPDGKTLTVPGVGVYTANATGTVTFAPANGYSGATPSVLYSVSDGVTTKQASIAVTVTSQTVSGKVFTDTNGNGLQDASEPGISGATVTITARLGGTQTVTTDASGDYTTAVPVGSATITVTTPTGMALTTANNPQTLNVPTGGATATPIGFQPRAAIAGVIFTDTNGNGVQDAGESGISGATVTITPVGGGTPVTVTTDANGNYSAPNLPLGNYTVSTGTPSNTTLTTANNPQTVTLPVGGASATPIGFKPVTSGGITGKVFNDSNGNGILEANEAGLSGATVSLYDVKADGTPDLTKPLRDASGKPITAITDASGNYSFPGIPSGPVAILVTDPSGKVLTTANNPQVVTVPSGASVAAAAVGYVQPKIDLTLTPDVTVVTPGDNLPYTAVITNNTPGTITALNNPVLNITLPKGVVYDPTKPVTVDGVVIPAGSIILEADPTDPTRQILTIKLPNSLVNKTPQTVKFSTVVTPAVDPNKPLIAVGQVTATAGTGVTAVSVSSNAVAAAAVSINLGVFSTDTIILGRVYFDQNSNNNFDAGDVPLPGARIYLSDGRYAVTDSQGRYNITGVKPGSYAVRLDPVTAPYAPKRVPDDQGAPGTRYVNANQGGGITNEDFPLETPLAVAVKSRSTVVQRGPVTLEKKITQGGAGYAVTYTITITGAVSNLAITDPLPAGAQRGPVTGATLEGDVLRFVGITQPGTYTVTFALFSAAPPDLILTDPEILYAEILTLIPSSPPNSSSGSDRSSPNDPASSGGFTNSQEVKR